MEQMNADGLRIVALDYADSNIPDSVQRTHPLVFIDGETYCCLLGPDPIKGIYGCGQTIQNALDEFDRHYKERLENPVSGDPVSEFIHQRHV